jgi:hypothetical protein
MKVFKKSEDDTAFECEKFVCTPSARNQSLRKPSTAETAVRASWTFS